MHVASFCFKQWCVFWVWVLGAHITEHAWQPADEICHVWMGKRDPGKKWAAENGYRETNVDIKRREHTCRRQNAPHTFFSDTESRSDIAFACYAILKTAASLSVWHPSSLFFSGRLKFLSARFPAREIPGRKKEERGFFSSHKKLLFFPKTRYVFGFVLVSTLCIREKCSFSANELSRYVTDFIIIIILWGGEERSHISRKWEILRKNKSIVCRECLAV